MQNATTSFSIMLVDDTPKNIQLLGTILGRKGYQLYVAQNGMEALMISEKVKLDLILLDVMMPEMDGFETCRKLKLNNKSKDIPVIFLTARTESEDIVRGFKEGAVDYITKPFNSSELLARVHTHLDIKRKEKKILQLSQAVEQSSVCAFITDLDGNIEYTNSKFCTLTGYALNEVLGKTPKILKSGKMPPERYKELWQLITAGKEWRGEMLNKKKSGEPYWVSASISPIKDANGDFTHFLAIQEDITEKKLINEKLKQSYQTIQSQNEMLEKQNTDKKELIHILCHDLLNPIGNIQNIIQLIEEQPDIVSELIESLSISSKISIEIINMVRRYMAIESGKKEIVVEKNNLKEMVQDARKLIKYTFEKKALSLHVEVPDDLYVMVERVSFISSVLSNLLTNAAKFSYRNSTIQILARREGEEQIKLTVKDSGIGIPDGILENIFKINKATTRCGTAEEFGTGFGMPLVKKYIDAYEGGINIITKEKSEQSNESGTEIILTFKSAL